MRRCFLHQLLAAFALPQLLAWRSTHAADARATGTSALRTDRLHATSCRLGYAFTAYFSATVAYACELGWNGEDGLGHLSPAVDSARREFDHHVVSAGAVYKY